MVSFHRKYKNTTTADQYMIKKWLELLKKHGRRFKVIVTTDVRLKTLQKMFVFVQRAMVTSNALPIFIRNA